jgi:hypothetical protein
LIQYWSNPDEITLIPERIISIFKDFSGLTMSCGIGSNIQESLYYLNLAKNAGKNRIEFSDRNAMNLSRESYTTLYMLTTSDRPDVYVNAIAYCLENPDFEIKKIILAGINKDETKKWKYESRLRLIRERVLLQIEALQDGQYIPKFPRYKNLVEEDDIQEFNHEGRLQIMASSKTISVSDSDRKMYRKISTLEIELEVLPYKNLQLHLRLPHIKNCIFDLSGFLKSYMLEVFFLLRRQGIKEIYSFEIQRDERSYDELELIHNLDLNSQDYEYQNLARSAYTQGMTVVSEESQFDRHKKSEAYEKLKNAYAEDFANTYLAAFFMIAFFLFLTCLYIVIQGGWDGLEPWTFLALPFLGYLLEIVFQLFKRDFSVKPKFLFSFLKHKKLGQIENRMR